MKQIMYLIIALSSLCSCHEKPDTFQELNELPDIYPDYIDVTIPETIAPLNFTISECEKIYTVLEGNNKDKITVGGKNTIQIPFKKWKKLLSDNKGKTIQITVYVKQNNQWRKYRPFPIHISMYVIDYGLAYRLIAPGYEAYSKMGIYERRLSDFKQTAIVENTLITGSCVNCHSFNKTQSTQMSLHFRGKHGGTLLQTGDDHQILSLKTDKTISEGVYPYWHPSGKYIAYSVNSTQQAFHSIPDKRVEVFDNESDVIVYDIESNKVLSTPLLSTENFETFPAFSPDGKTLYFCCSMKRKLLDDYNIIRYNLCSISFDPQTGKFGDHIDTLIQADKYGKSISFPRPSYDGKYIMYGLADYGNFHIWHKEADLWLLELNTGKQRAITEVNSPNTESYHSWSSNSHWFVFASRRQDGLYSKLYLASIDENGKVTKPFLLPQQEPQRYDPSFYSFNVPEFISEPVKLNRKEVEQDILSDKRKKATYELR